LQFAEANAQTKKCKRAFTSAARRKNYFSNTFPLNIFKPADTKVTIKAQINSDLTKTVERRPAYNSTYKKLAVQWLNEALFFVSSFVVADSLVLRNRQLLVAANR
jgi:hypothetical protein